MFKSSLRSCLSIMLVGVASSAAAQVETFRQESYYQDALSSFSWDEGCKTTLLDVNLGESTLENSGQPVESSNYAFFRYFVEDTCDGTTIRRFSATARIPDVAVFEQGMDAATISLALNVRGRECVELDGQFTCANKTLAIDITVDWLEDGPLETRRNNFREVGAGMVTLSREVTKTRAAIASVQGTIDQQVVEADSDSARFYMTRRRITMITLP